MIRAYPRGVELCSKFAAEGIAATVDPRSATPPCVLIAGPPRRIPDLACGITVEWQLVALAPGPGNADAWVALEDLVEGVEAVLGPVETQFMSYSLSPDNPPFPAYVIRYQEAI